VEDRPMTEAEWLACVDSSAMLNFWYGTVSDFDTYSTRPMCERKLRLFAVSCCRNVWDHFNKTLQQVIGTGEDYADSRVTEQVAAEAVDVALSEGGGDIDSIDEASSSAFYTAHPTVEPDDMLQMADGVAYYTRITGRGSDTQAHLARDILGNPFRPVTFDSAWRTATVTSLAEAIYEERAFDRMPILADALEDAGCTSADILNHCREPGVHVRGCWVVDLVLGKA
jgi:hypothetical protein